MQICDYCLKIGYELGKKEPKFAKFNLIFSLSLFYVYFLFLLDQRESIWPIRHIDEKSWLLEKIAI